MFNSEYQWQHDYVRLVFDSGFCFERQKFDNFDKNKISAIDVDRIILERDFGSIDKLIPNIIKFALDPDQAQVLDECFVKTFQLSQLSVQYLLFCKKYLDNTLSILKKELKKLKADNSELNLFVEDLKSHISNLMTEIDDKPVFKCTQCSKFFSSEDFLNSHIKRRHSAQNEEADTDKLHMEIKELKGRLNNAEKIIQQEQNKSNKELDVKKIEDLQQKFEDLRILVQSELNILQTQHSFQEKYEKLFEKMVFTGGGEYGYRKSITHVTSDGSVKFAPKDKDILEVNNTQKQITEFGEALESKVVSSLEKIENQMQSFWSKLTEMEKYKSTDNQNKSRPTIRPKSKYSTKRSIEDDEVSKGSDSSIHFVNEKEHLQIEKSRPTQIPSDNDHVNIVNINVERNLEQEKAISVKYISQKALPEHSVTTEIRSLTPEFKTQTGRDLDETTTSETLASESVEKISSPPKVLPRKFSLSCSAKKSTEADISDELLQELRIEVEKIIWGRLQDLGVSPDWIGIPNRSYQRAMEIVNHQASLMKKTYPNFDNTLKHIERIVIEKTNGHPDVEININPKQKTVAKRGIRNGTTHSPKIEIKNRQVYDTDSDSEVKILKDKENFQFSVPYSAVIEELKAVTSKIESSDKEFRATTAKMEDQTKGVLKSYPSAGSLTKKKVLFNLDTNVKKNMKENGSTTSVASSVLDGTPRKEDRKKDREKDIEDLSDFDFSEM